MNSFDKRKAVLAEGRRQKEEKVQTSPEVKRKSRNILFVSIAARSAMHSTRKDASVAQTSPMKGRGVPSAN
jgi:hypothetical protein